MAQRTEKAIADAFKKLLAKRPLKKITISDIAEECGINRMTFYYHYRDVYDLIEHICNDSFREALEGNRTLANWQAGIQKLMEIMRSDQAFYTGLYQCVEREKVFDYLYRLIAELLDEGIDQVQNPTPVKTEERQFIVDFYSFAFCGLMIQWVRDGMQEEPAVLVDRMAKVGYRGLHNSIQAFTET